MLIKKGSGSAATDAVLSHDRRSGAGAASELAQSHKSVHRVARLMMPRPAALSLGLRLRTILLLLALAGPAAAAGSLSRPLMPADVAVVINTQDPLSQAIGAYYIARRHIPRANVAWVRFDRSRDELPVASFAAVKAKVEKQIGAGVQAYALTWARPYRVGCMSITAAFAFGFDPKYCATGCQLTQRSPYFNSHTSRPYEDLHIRPAMSLAALDLKHARELINRGIASDGTLPSGTAYLVLSGDRERNVRALEYRSASALARHRIRVEQVSAPLQGRSDVLFYFIGAATVPGLASNRFVPGAVADHLTSFGGMLTDSPQMSSLRWLTAGATGSYGTVTEPCNFLGKFPDVPVLLAHYLSGESLIESYWKSVEMPGQGLFIGEPLAAPFRHHEPGVTGWR